MSPEIHQRVRLLFDEALQHPEAERTRFLETACAGNAEVFGQVAQLLAAHAEAGHFLEDAQALPQRIGRYVVTGELGRGAMGIVYEAIDPLIGRKVAVKVIRLQALANGSEAAFLRERLFREARAAGGLFHPGIVVILDVGQQGDLAFIAMEYVDGPSLFQLLAARTTIERGQALKILQQTAVALDFAHDKGVVHRDIKPANIMLEKAATVKVADFGIAKIVSPQHLTKTGSTMGTPSYMSPEQVDAKPLDGKSDQFSLAVVAYELLAGAPPFRAESFTALVHTVAYGPRPSARAEQPLLPAAIDQVFYRGLNKRPEERYPSCSEFVAALERALTGKMSVAKSHTPLTVRNRAGRPSRYVVAGVVAAMLLVSVGLSYKWLPSAHKRPPVVPDIMQFSADPQSIVAGGQVTLRWNVSGATGVAIEPGIGKKPASDRLLVSPASSIYYVLSSSNDAGAVFQQVFVEVKPVDPLRLYLDGKKKFRHKEFAEGLLLLRAAGMLGDTRAMMELGGIYWDGTEGQTKDEPEALEWYRKAAIAGDPDGMRNLGAFYDLGLGVPENPASAALWYERAGEQGSADATYDLAEMYTEGRGVPRDPKRARVLYEHAAGMGSTEAKKRLIQLMAASQASGAQTN